MQKLLKRVMTLFSIYLTVFMFLSPKESLTAAKDALNLCASSVVPALFPYLVSSSLLTSLGATKFLSRYLSPLMRPLFGINGSGAAALLLGSISGYPIGAVCTRDLYTSGECTKNEAERMLAFCNNSGPLFIISVVGCGFLKSAALGRLLYLSHILSALLVAVFLRLFHSTAPLAQKALPKNFSPKTENPFQILGGVIDSSVLTMLKICGYIIFFSILSKSLAAFSSSPFLHALLEITGGISKISQISLKQETKLCLISFFAAFSGISVLFQVSAVISETDLSLKFYLPGKLLQGVLSFFITKALIGRFPNSVDTFAKSAQSVVFTSPQSAFLTSVFMILSAFLVLFLLSLLSAIRYRR